MALDGTEGFPILAARTQLPRAREPRFFDQGGVRVAIQERSQRVRAAAAPFFEELLGRLFLRAVNVGAPGLDDVANARVGVSPRGDGPSRARDDVIREPLQDLLVE